MLTQRKYRICENPLCKARLANRSKRGVCDDECAEQKRLLWRCAKLAARFGERLIVQVLAELVKQGVRG